MDNTYGTMQLQPSSEITNLEEFLVQTGAINIVNQEIVVNTEALNPIDSLQQPDWPQHMSALRRLTVPHFGNPTMDTENQFRFSMPLGGGATSSDSQVVVERKRGFSDEMLEKTIERRQKRMIKNRESAARSRAKKQAHNNNLQYQGSQLRIMNKKLMKEKDMFLRLDPDPRPKYQLRRTSSALI